MILTQTIQQQVLLIMLNRPEHANALHPDMVTALLEQLEVAANNRSLRALVICGEGKHFCAGADLKSFENAANVSDQQRLHDARQLALLFRQLDHLPLHTIAMVRGAVRGGGCGLVCCCDTVIADTSASFAFSELRLGLIPATILPYIRQAIGERQSRHLVLSASGFDVQQALQSGLVHRVVDPQALEAEVDNFIQQVLKTAPDASRYCKQLILSPAPAADDCVDITARQLASQLLQQECRQGIDAFLNRTPPPWEKRYED